MPGKMLVISAHVGDFVWRSAGTIARYVEKGWKVKVLCLTYGARGESASYYKNHNGSYEDCCEVRKNEGLKAAEVLGAEVVFCGYEDFCLEMDEQRVNELAEEMKQFAPDIILTHDNGKDHVNPDHTTTAIAVLKAYELARDAGMKYAPAYGFEPMNPELCGYTADTYIDVTEVWEKKCAAMDCMVTQKKSRAAYEEKALFRASYAGGRGGNKNCKYAETFRSYFPIYVYDDFAV